ncbi:hypothetical protein AB8616_19200 [Marinomonas sp. RS-M-Aa-14]|uniref:hypothetical protein n=1 Tax=Marinomonas sp. RS-M-Aa-14 TaxID=3241169 RepID=UPI003AB053C9
MTFSNREDFRNKGVLKLSSVIDIEKILDAQSYLWQEVKHKFSINIDEPSTWFSNAHNPVGDAGAKRLNGMGSIMREAQSLGEIRRDRKSDTIVY